MSVNIIVYVLLDISASACLVNQLTYTKYPYM